MEESDVEFSYKLKTYKMKSKSPSYNEAINEIEVILEKIENGEPDVDELTSLVKRAGYLIKLCRTKLQLTEKEINSILNEESDT